MATRVGTGSVGVTTANSNPPTVAVGQGGFGHFKWEAGSTPPATFNDNLGNLWTVAQSVLHTTGNEPGSALCYCLSFTNAGVLNFSPSGFSGAAPTFQRCEVEIWQPAGGTTFVLDVLATPVQGTGTGAAFIYNAVSLTATGAGVAFFAVSDFSALGGVASNGGTPAFTVGNANAPNGDSFLAYATVTGAGTVAPSVGLSGGTNRWIQQLMMIKEVTAGAAAVLSSPFESAVTQSTATLNVTSDTAGGTLYAALTSTNVQPSNAQIKAGSGATIVNSISGAAVLGLNSLAETGLAPGTTYYVWYLQGTGTDSNVVTDAFTTQAAPVSYPMSGGDLYF